MRSSTGMCYGPYLRSLPAWARATIIAWVAATRPMLPATQARSVNASTPSPRVSAELTRKRHWIASYGRPVPPASSGRRRPPGRRGPGRGCGGTLASRSSRAATFASKSPSSPAASAGLVVQEEVVVPGPVVGEGVQLVIEAVARGKHPHPGEAGEPAVHGVRGDGGPGSGRTPAPCPAG